METKKKGTIVFYDNKQFNSIADLCRHIGIEPYSKEYRKIKRRICDLGHSVKDAVEGTQKNRCEIARQARATLTADKVREIRKIRSTDGLSFLKLAKLFNVAPSTINDIVNRKTWSNI